MNAKSFLGALLILAGAFVALLAGAYGFMLALPAWTQGDGLSVAMTIFFGGIPVLFGVRMFQRGRRVYSQGDGARESAGAPLSKASGYQRKKSVVYFAIVVAAALLFLRGHFNRQTLIFASIGIVISGVRLLLTFVETAPGEPKDGMIETGKKTKDIMKD